MSGDEREREGANMVCGFCGTEIKPGFSTCPQCGAMLSQSMGCLGQIFILLAMGVSFVLFLVGLYLAYSGHVLSAVVVWAVVVVIFGIARKVPMRGKYSWVRRGPGR